jgi:23S rRNA (uracil1939-C5)-methyltransferase
MKKKNKYPRIDNISIQGIAAEGKCIARHEDRVIFIEGQRVAPEDVVDLQIIGKRKNYWEGVPVAFHSYSNKRVQPFCEHFGTCGGCKWQHLDYQAQLAYKQQQVVDALVRIGKVALPEVEPILPAPSLQYYRNKLEYTFSNKRWKLNDEPEGLPEGALGFHIAGHYDKTLPIKHCFLQPEPSNELRQTLEKYAFESGLPFYDHKKQEGFWRNVMFRTANTGQAMVMLMVAQPNHEEIEKVMAFLQHKIPQITSWHYIINTKLNDTYFDLTPVHYAGKPYIEEKMMSLSGRELIFRVSPKSFFQTNSEQAYNLYKIAGEMADLTGEELVYDLYTGTGTIACFVADRAKKVVGIEYVTEAIEDAKVNAQINQIAHTSFYAGDMKDLLKPALWNAEGKPDVVITDPPRAGMDVAVAEALMHLAPKTIVYVSCNPATQARDLSLLGLRYDVVAVQPVDMFPHTHHVENVVKLVRKN